MSGGRFEYKDSDLAYEIFGWQVSVDYRLAEEEREDDRKIARRANPFEDKEISELVYDVFCLIRSLDWYQSGDTSEDTYREDVEYFKKKWLQCPADERIKREIDKCLCESKKELYKIFCEDYYNDDERT